MKNKIFWIILTLSTIIGFYFGFNLPKKVVTIPTNEVVQQLPVNVKIGGVKTTIPKAKIITINNSGDKRILPIKGYICPIKDLKQDIEIPIEIDFNENIIHSMPKFKFVEFYINESYNIRPGFLIELKRYGDWNINVGYCFSPVMGIGYNLSPTLGLFLGAGSFQQIQPVFGISVGLF